MAVVPVGPGRSRSAGREIGVSRACVTVLADVEARQVEWLWRSRIPLGMLTVLDGDPGLGKSTVCLDLAARLSRGDAMPDGSPGPGAAGSVILSAEDDPARVIRPRLGAAGADLTLIAMVSVKDGKLERPPEITAEDLIAVEEAMSRVGAKLVIVDPLMAYLPTEVNSNRDQDVRRALVHLKDLAERTGAAIVVVRHLNKAPGGPALYRGGGSIGIIGAVRSGLLLAADPDAPEAGRVLGVVKSNLAPIAPSLRLVLAQESGCDFARVVWGAACTLSAAQLLAGADQPERHGKLAAAEEFLRDVLALEAVPASEVKREATESGIAPATLLRARLKLGVIHEKVGGPGQANQQWLWRLPYGVGEGGQALGSKVINTRAGDHLRISKRVSHSGVDGSLKVINTGEDDHLLGFETVDPEANDADLRVVDLAAFPLRLDDGDGRHPQDPLASESILVSDAVQSADSADEAGRPAMSKVIIASDHDHLRVSALDTPHCAPSDAEDDQLDVLDHLRVVEPINDPVCADHLCPLCDGPMIEWPFGRVCRSCHHLVAGGDLVGPISEPAVKLHAALDGVS
ncbi:MAG: AAA family ATPase [Candidatus Eisenbacteria bacterium]